MAHGSPAAKSNASPKQQSPKPAESEAEKSAKAPDAPAGTGASPIKKRISAIVDGAFADNTQKKVDDDSPAQKRQKKSTPAAAKCTIRAIWGEAETGKRPYMEDRHVLMHGTFRRPVTEKETALPPNSVRECTFIGVYDGHGGSSAVDFVRAHLHERIQHSKLWDYFGKVDGESQRQLQTHFAEIFAKIDADCIAAVASDQYPVRFNKSKRASPVCN